MLTIDNMTNQLTHALLAGALIALINPLLGIQVISWNVFLAGIVAMLLDMDMSEKTGPICHSLGFATAAVYVTGMVSFAFCALTGTPLFYAGLMVLTVAVGLFSHLCLDVLTGEQVYTFPRNLEPSSWFSKVDVKFDRFWGAWGRFSMASKQTRDSRVNLLSVTLLIVTIAVF